MNNLKFSTRAIHSEFLRDDPNGALHMPVYDNVAYEFPSSEEIELAFQGKKPSHMYSRTSNPTVEHFEQKIRNVTGAFTVLALSSGMAAISNTVLSLTGSGDNFITSKHLFGNTYSLFTGTLKSFALQVKFVDFSDINSINNVINSKTRFIFLETITNPQLEVANIKKISVIAKEKGIPLIVDTTLTPPYLFNALEHGVDIEIISSTKYISGGATSLGGLIIDYGTFDWNKNEKLNELASQYGPQAFMVKLRREVFRNFGACLSPHNAYLQSLGLETLVLRAKESCSNCLSVAKFLENSGKVQNVNYPGLESSKYFNISRQQFRMPGSLLTFDLGSKEECFQFMNNLKIIRRATNLNDNKTLILHPASTIFTEFSPEERIEMDVRETMIRLSVGIEDAEDIISDMQQAFDKIK